MRLVMLMLLSCSVAVAATKSTRDAGEVTTCDNPNHVDPEDHGTNCNQTSTSTTTHRFRYYDGRVTTITAGPITGSEVEPFPPELDWMSGSLLRGVPENSQVLGWSGPSIADEFAELEQTIDLRGEPGDRLGASLDSAAGVLLVGAPGSDRAYVVDAGAGSVDDATAILVGGFGLGASVAFGDFDADGQLDAAASSSTDTWVFFGPLEGELFGWSLGVGGGGLAVGDFEGNGLDNLAVAHADGRVEIFGAWLQPVATVYTLAESIAFADVDGDGADDLAVGVPAWDAVEIYRGGSDADGWVDDFHLGELGSGTGTSVHGDDAGGLWYSAPQDAGVGSVSHAPRDGIPHRLLGDGEISLRSAHAADVDGDGRLEMLTGGGNETSVHFRE